MIRDVETGKRRTLLVDGVFIEVGLSPNSDLVLDLARTNQRGEVIVDEWGDTGVRGVFAAGDVTANKDKQIVIAAGEGREGRAGGVRLPDLAALTSGLTRRGRLPRPRQAEPVCSRMNSTVRRS